MLVVVFTVVLMVVSMAVVDEKIGHKEVLERVIKITIMPEIQLRFPVVDENQYQKSNRLFHGILFGNAIMFKKNLRCHIIDVWP